MVDCQSTGASPAYGQVIEFGWSKLVPSAPQGDDAITGALIRLPEGARVPRVVTELTGIHGRDLEERGWDIHTAWLTLRGAALEVAARGRRRAAPTVIHYARFEQAFLRDLDAGSEGFPFDIVCTHEIARRLLPDLPRRGLRALAGYFGFTSPQLRRSGEHVAATAFVWSHLVRTLDERDAVRTWDDLQAWLAATPRRRPRRRAYPMSREKRLALPDVPGVYRMLRQNGDVLYVGKATSLKKRVNSYFGKQRRVSERHLEMLTQARDLEVTPTATPLEAALLESDEIKRLAPPYNRVLLGARDTVLDRFPDEEILRGPFPYASALVPLVTMARLWQRPSPELDPLDPARALGMPRRWAPEPGVFAEGLAAFIDCYPLEPNRPATQSLLRLGKHLWAQRLAEERQPSGGADLEPSADDLSPEGGGSDALEAAVGWTAEQVRDKLEEVVRRVSHLCRRARWLCRLTESTVAWREAKLEGWRVLHLGQGQVLHAEALTAPQMLPAPPGYAASFAARQRTIDAATYDRLRTLTSELRRVLNEGGECSISFAPGVVCPGEALRRGLNWL